MAANVCSKPQCPAELLTTHFLVRRGIERVEELNTSPRASVCCLLCAGALNYTFCSDFPTSGLDGARSDVCAFNHSPVLVCLKNISAFKL